MRGVGLALVLGAALAGCEGRCPDLWYDDLDGDGFGDPTSAGVACRAPEGTVPNGLDCDDLDAAVHPGAAERCNDRDDDCDTVVDAAVTLLWYLDRDADTWGDRDSVFEGCDPPPNFVPEPGDCDDFDATASPDGVETCDGQDEDCDGLVDDGVGDGSIWFQDVDGDGWGNPEVSTTWCDQPTGWVAIDGDCDDADAQTSPDAAEACGGGDEDCDELVDDDDTDVLAAVPWYRDLDGDGFGDAGAVLSACESPSADWVDNLLDCDDSAGATSPDGIEVCGGADEDCDGDWDDDDGDVDPASLSAWWPDVDGDGLGAGAVSWSCVAPATAVGNDDDCDDGDASVGADLWRLDGDRDGFGIGAPAPGSGCAPPGPGWASAAAPDDCDDGDATVSPGAVEACGDGVDQDCSGFDGVCPAPLQGELDTADAAAFVFGPSGGAALGVVSGAGDLNGDGRPELALGAPGESVGAASYGAVHLAFGPVPEAGGAWEVAGPWIGDLVGAEAGGSLAPAGDLDGDGLDDLLVGLPARGLAANVGAVALLHGDLDPTRLALEVMLLSDVGASQLGTAVAAVADLDGDGVGAILATAPRADSGGIDGGAAYLVAADVAPASGVSAAAGLVVVGGSSAGLGSSVAVADLDGDATPELALGAADGAHVVVLGADATGIVLEGAAPLRVDGVSGDRTGASLAAGDLDGDGSFDLLVGSPAAAGGAVEAGAVWLVPGGSAGALAVDASGVGVLGVADLDLLGSSVAVLGDADGDAWTDLVVGAAGADRAYVFFGPLAGLTSADAADAILVGPVASAFGATVAGPGDLDGDGLDDVAVGAPDHALPAAGAGAAWVFRGMLP